MSSNLNSEKKISKKKSATKATQTNLNFLEISNSNGHHSHLYHERPYLNPKEQKIPFFYTTHSILAMFIIFIPVIYIAIIDPPKTMDEVWKPLFWILLVIYFTIGAMVFPSGPFIRPHPLFWRLVFATSLLYLIFIIVLIVLPVMDARLLLAAFDPSLGKPIELPLYAEDCTLNWPNFSSKMDRFVFAHFLGWMAKGLLVRHRMVLWFMSFAWECIELSTVYYIPNFAECWWDQWLLDFLICNGLGIEGGLLLCKYLEYRRYEWCDIISHKSILSKICDICRIFRPQKEWVIVRWEAHSSITRFFKTNLIIAGICFADMNAFLLKLYLWIPTDHWWNLARMIFIVLISIPTMRQWFFYTTDARVHRMGTQTFFTLAIIFAEFILIVKCSPDDIPPAPFINKICWVICAVLYFVFSYMMVTACKPHSNEKQL